MQPPFRQLVQLPNDGRDEKQQRHNALDDRHHVAEAGTENGDDKAEPDNIERYQHEGGQQPENIGIDAKPQKQHHERINQQVMQQNEQLPVKHAHHQR